VYDVRLVVRQATGGNMTPGTHVRSTATGWLAMTVERPSKAKPPTVLVHWCEGPLAGKEARVERSTLRPSRAAADASLRP